MNIKHQPYIDTWLAHIRYLAQEIGPRGSTTEAERRAAMYCKGEFSRLDLQPKADSFPSARSIYHPHLLAANMLLLSFIIYPIAGRISAGIAASLSFIALISDLCELSFRNNLLRWFVPKEESQNVYATIEPKAQHRQDIILIGHMDSHRTPLIFKTPRWVAIYQVFTTIAFILFLTQVVLYILGAVTQWTWVRPASIPSAVGAILLALMCLQADRTSYSAGANDNATGAGLVLTLAAHLRAESLRFTKVWAVCTGCEEVQHYGAIDFFQRHRNDLTQPKVIVFEMLGCAGPAWLIKEGIVVPFHADRNLITLVEQLAQEHPEWGAYPTQIKGGNTEMADALRAGIPAITLIGMGPNGEMPYWHQKEDTFDKIKPEVLERAYAFSWSLIQRFDSQMVEGVPES